MAYNHHPIRIIAFVVMGNHIHLIALVEDPVQVESFMERFNRRKQTLFIDARKLGTLIDRVHRELADADLEKITSTYHLWRGDPHPTSGHPLPVGEGRGEGNPGYADIAGFCKSATTAEIAAHGHVLTPGRYVGAEEIEDDGDPFDEKMPRLVAELHAQFAESEKIEVLIKRNLEGLGYGL